MNYANSNFFKSKNNKQYYKIIERTTSLVSKSSIGDNNSTAVSPKTDMSVNLMLNLLSI